MRLFVKLAQTRSGMLLALCDETAAEYRLEVSPWTHDLPAPPTASAAGKAKLPAGGQHAAPAPVALSKQGQVALLKKRLAELENELELEDASAGAGEGEEDDL